MKQYASILFERSASPAERLALLNRGEKRSRSWYLCETEFAPILETLRNTPPARTEENGLIYSSSGKYVWKMDYDSPSGKVTVAYKTNPGKTPWRYIFKSSLTIREMRNYLRFEELGIPVAHVVAVGDQRKNFILQETFIVTEFLENTRDGRVFMSGGTHRADREDMLAFCRLNVEQLAKLHHANIFHKAFHARNLLWRKTENGKMEVFLIDVARCRKVSSRFMPRAVIWDLHTFFRDMRLKEPEIMEVIEHYMKTAPQSYLPEGGAAAIMDELLHFRRRLFSRKKYKIISEE